MKNFSVKSVFSQLKTNSQKFGHEICTICKKEECDYLCENQGIFVREKTGSGVELKIEW